MPAAFTRLALRWALCLSVAACVHGEVVWDALSQGRTAKAEDAEIVFSFPFAVRGKAVGFLPSEIPCGCAFAGADKPTYQPGERGTFTVRLLVEDRIGLQEVDIIARTDDASAPCQPLKLVAEIPELLKFSRKILVWDAKSGPSAQHVRCTVDPGYAITSATAVSQHASVGVQVEKTADPRVYELVVSLASTSHRQPVRIELTTDLPVKRQAVATLWAVNRLP